MRTVLGCIERLVPGRGTALVEQLHRTADLLTRRGLIVLISDLYDDPDSLMKGLEHLRFQGNDVIVFQVLDRQELDFDFQEPVVLEDSETEEQLHVMPDVLRDEYLRQIRAHVDALRQGAARNRIDFELLRTSEPLDAALFSYLARRSQLG
jgi:3-deoxy-D-arabino-heptulosonate 7-phosphate (DAHP) synthase